MSEADQDRSAGSPDPMDVRIGAGIRRVRKAAGMTQTQLADAVGVRFQQIQKYETGANRIYASRLKQIADALGVSVLALYGDMNDRAAAHSMLVPPPDMTLEEAQNHLTALSALPDELRAHFVGLLASLSKS